MNEKLTRAKAVARARGVQTKAATVAGVLKACRRPGMRPAVPVHRAAPSRRVAASIIVDAEAQAPRDRARTLPAAAPLRAALGAALGAAHYDSIERVPNCYRGTAYASYASAERIGRAVLVNWGRTACRAASHGRGEDIVYPTGSVFVLAHELLALLPFRRTIRWYADELGPYIKARGLGNGYHPTGEQLRDLISTGDYRSILAAGRELASYRRETARRNAATRKADIARRRAYAARLRRIAAANPGLVVTVSDAQAAGHCRAGALAWARQHGIRGEQCQLATLLPFAMGDRRVGAAIVAAVRRSK